MKYPITFPYQQTRTTIRSRWQYLFRQVATLCICLLSMGALYAQTPSTPIKEIKIGDTIPDIVIQNILQSNGQKVKTSDLYKGGMLLIDFWATWCIPCIAQMKEMDTLKKQFPKFHSISVTEEDSVLVKKFFTYPRNADIEPDRLLIATNDTTLKQYFKHRFLPHNVWIDSMGIVKAITGGTSVTADNVSEFLATQDLSNKSEIVKEDRRDFDWSKPFHLGDSLFQYRSIITPYISGIGGGSTGDGKSGKVKRFFSWNNSIASLYWQAFSSFRPALNENLMEIRTLDTLRFHHPLSDYLKGVKYIFSNSKYSSVEEWSEQNLWCYELTLPNSIPRTLFAEYMMQDLNRFFHLKTKIENRDIQSIVIRKSDEILKVPTTAFPDSAPYVVFNYPKLLAKNIKVDDLIHYLMEVFVRLKEPIINKTGYDEPFDLDLDFTDELATTEGISLEMVLYRLREMGLEASHEIHSNPILIIEDLENSVENKDTALESRD